MTAARMSGIDWKPQLDRMLRVRARWDALEATMSDQKAIDQLSVEVAYPMVVPPNVGWHAGGLTKLEYAAIHIAAGVAADPDFEGDISGTAVRLAQHLMKDLVEAAEDIHERVCSAR